MYFNNIFALYVGCGNYYVMIYLWNAEFKSYEIQKIYVIIAPHRRAFFPVGILMSSGEIVRVWSTARKRA